MSNVSTANVSALLGYNVTDKITGLKGVITAVAEFLYGPQRIGITPSKMSKGEPVEALWLDKARLKVGKLHTEVGALPLTVKLGDKVKDTVTGFKGIATGRYTFLNGCIRIEVTPEELKDGKPIEHVVFDEQRLTGKPSGLPGGPRPGPTPYATDKR